MDSSEVIPLQNAGRARDIADWLIGINLTIAMTKKFSRNENLLTVGRVQTPTLALIVNREKAIKSHIKTPFWKLNGVFSFSDREFEAEYERGNFEDENEANNVLALCNGHDGIVKSKETKRKFVSAPLLFNSTQLQIAASEKLGWETEKTEKIMQSLYLRQADDLPSHQF